MMSCLCLVVLQGPETVASALCAKLVLPPNQLSSQDPCLGLAHVTVTVVVFCLRTKNGSEALIIHHVCCIMASANILC